MRRDGGLSAGAKSGALILMVAVGVGGVFLSFLVFQAVPGLTSITSVTTSVIQKPTEAPRQQAQTESKATETTVTTTQTTQRLTEESAKPKTELESQRFPAVNDFVYQLQNIDSAMIGNTKFDLVIIDYSQDGSEAARFTSGQISALRNSPGGRKLVLAYMSIGEAEDYRWYLNKSWDANNDGIPDPGAPSWLGPANPRWPGNYKVKYWEVAWQSLIYGSPTSYLDKIIEAGFDGVYLDIIDAYEYWGPGGESGLNRMTAEQEMVDFVKAIANYARVTKGKANFGIFPQNGEGLSSHPDYVAVVDGIGREDTWYDDNTPQPASHTSEVIANLDVFKRANKLVLVIDYVTKQELIDDFYSRAHAKGYVPYATVRELNVLTINVGHDPDWEDM